MNHERIFSAGPSIPFPFPREIIFAPIDEAIISHPDNSTFSVCDAGTDLRGRVFAPASRQKGQAHKIIPF
jgi:hypothetical protein